uniref:Uncharacterized protein n=1 Tax=Arundo donax TaxID=35708 RepID=A0A0A9A0N8_ARUDO
MDIMYASESVFVIVFLKGVLRIVLSFFSFQTLKSTIQQNST